MTNGLVCEEPLRRLCEITDAMNIDVKGFTDEFYMRVCGAHLEDVLRSAEAVYGYGVHLELTYLVIPAALRMIRDGGIIHYHDTFYVGEQERRVREIFDPLCDYEILGIREVKSFAPSVSHYVADLRILSRSPRSR